MRKTILALAVAASLALTVGVGGSAAFTGTPSGERAFHQSGLEPFYDAEHAGTVGIMLTPLHTPDPTKANPAAWSPIYLPVYPVGSTAADVYICQYEVDGTIADNCPSHGKAIADLAQACPTELSADCTQAVRDVYADGVAGHDHVMDFPGGEDFDVAWMPIVVLFTSKEAGNQHLLTDQQIEDAVAAGDAIEIPLPFLTFHCSVVSNRIWDLGTPVPPDPHTG